MHTADNATPAGGSVVLTDTALTRLMQQIEQTQAGMYTCAETDALLDEYVDLVADDADAAKLMPLVERHLAVCPGCHEKFDILRDIVQDTSIDSV